LTESETVGGSTDRADLVNSLKDGEQVKIKAPQVEHDIPPD
jgi:hypothetical protein